MTNATTDEVVTVLTTAAVEADFNFTGLWITLGVLGGFVLSIVLYGICITLWGKVYLPPRTEDKQPLTRETGDEAKEKPSEKKTPDITRDDSQVEPAVAAMPPSYNEAATAPSSSAVGQTRKEGEATNTAGGLASSREDLVDGGDGNKEVKVEVYEQDVDMTDEKKKD